MQATFTMYRHKLDFEAFESAHHYKLWKICVLCRMRLDYLHGNMFRQPADAWDNNIIIFSDMSEGIFQAPELFATTADLFGNHEVVGSLISITAPGKERRKIHICNESIMADCDDNNPHCAFYAVHLCCWKLAQYQQQSSLLQLLKLAQQTKPLISVIDEHHFVPFINEKYFSVSTDLGCLLYAVGQYLPLELQQRVASHIPNSFIASIFSAAYTIDTILSLVDPKRQTSVVSDVINIDGTEATGWLAITQTSLFGRSYLRNIEIMAKQPTTQQSTAIQVHLNSIYGLHFVLGPLGITALRVCCQDGGASVWVGNPTDGTYGVLHGCKLSNIQLIHDDLKILRLALANVAQLSVLSFSPEKRWPQKVLWASDDGLSQNLRLRMMDTCRYPGQIPYYFDWRYLRYLSLEYGSSYATGLTLYCGRHIAGLSVHGKHNRHFGYRFGCPIHLALDPKERIDSIFLIAEDDGEGFCSLLVCTSRGRCRLFANSQIQSYLSGGTLKSVLLTGRESGTVTGLIMDPLTELHGYIRSMGVAMDTHRVPEDIQVNKAILLPELQKTTGGWFSTAAKLSNVRRMKARLVKTRYTGIFIEYADGAVETLGQWVPDNVNYIVVLYDISQGPLQALSFIYSDRIGRFKSNSQHVVGISVGSIPPRDLHCFTWRASTSEGIAWEFHENSDKISCWDGAMTQVNLSHQSLLIKELSL